MHYGWGVALSCWYWRTEVDEALVAQVVGAKTVWLAPPSVSPYMTSTTSSSSNSNANSNSNSSAALSNTSPHDVFAPLTSLSPTFAETVTPKASSALLEEGDVLFFPPGWWHAMRAECASFSVSMWF